MGIVRRPRKEVQGCFQYMELNKKFLFNLKTGNLKIQVLGKPCLLPLNRSKSRGEKIV